MTNDEALQTLRTLERFLDVQWSKESDPDLLAMIEELALEVFEIRRRAAR